MSPTILHHPTLPYPPPSHHNSIPSQPAPNFSQPAPSCCVAGCLAWLAVKIHAGLGRDPYTRDWRIEWLTRWGTDPVNSSSIRKSPQQLSVESQYEFDTGCTWPFFFHPSSHPPFSPHMKKIGTTFCRIEVRILRTLYMAIFFFHWIHPSLLSPYKIQNTSNTYNDHNQVSNTTYICPLLHFDSIKVCPMSSSTVSSILLLIRLHLQYIQEHIHCTIKSIPIRVVSMKKIESANRRVTWPQQDNSEKGR